MSGLEQFLIFTRGGLILWSLTTAALKSSPIDALIRSCLLEDRSAQSSFRFDAGEVAYTLKWAFHNELGLVFVAVAFQQLSHLLPLDQLLTSVRQHFSDEYDPKQTSYPGFDETFRRIQQDAEAKLAEIRISKQTAKPAPTPAKKNVLMRPAVLPEKGKDSGEKGDGADKASSYNPNFVINRDTSAAPPDEGAFDVSKLQKLGARKGEVKKGKPGPKNKGPKVPVKNGSSVRSEDLKLDFTDPVGKGDGNDVVEVAAVGNLGESGMDRDDEVAGIESEEEEEVGNEKPRAKKKGWFSSMFKSISGKSILEKSDLEPALKALKDRLMTKNVAEEIAEKVCESVAASLDGKKLGSFTRVSSTVQAAMEEALLRILTPRRSIDILREVHDAKEKGKPYVIVFVGVNGVGKSTNLAKVAYWLQQHDISVMLAACDTFRSGAVEQLRVHACRLKIDIFERGYEKDPAMVAKAAIEEAGRINGVTGLSKADVVLVDTAGRMQDNEPLMRALSKLINLNNPDLVLFVGEALVGNDAVDQLTKFNQKLIDLSPTKSGRSIDGILLTKFDTIDDKVGAALSMVYISGAPVMFVGCGQSYTDLKKLNVKTIVKTLLT